MENGIKLECLAIKETIITIWTELKSTKSLKCIVDVLNPDGRYRIGNQYYTGNYYTFAKEMYKRGYVAVGRRDDL